MAVYETALERVNNDRKSRAGGQMSFFDSILKEDNALAINYPNLPEIDNFQKLKKEKEVIGIYLSGHPLDKYIDQMKNYSFNSSMIQVEDDDEMMAVDDEETEDVGPRVVDYGIADGTRITCGGIVSEIKKTITKTNQSMAIVTMEDLYGNFDVMFFPKMYERVKNDLVEDSFVTIEGKFSARPGERPIVMGERLSLWKNDEESARENEKSDIKTQKSQKLFLRFDLENASLKNDVFDCLESYAGFVPVLVKSGSTLFDTHKLTSAKPGCIAELEALLGKENVVLK